MHVATCASVHVFPCFVMQNALRTAPLMVAAEQGHLETIEKLLNEGANVNHQNNVRSEHF